MSHRPLWGPQHAASPRMTRQTTFQAPAGLERSGSLQGYGSGLRRCAAGCSWGCRRYVRGGSGGGGACLRCSCSNITASQPALLQFEAQGFQSRGPVHLWRRAGGAGRELGGSKGEVWASKSRDPASPPFHTHAPLTQACFTPHSATCLPSRCRMPQLHNDDASAASDMQREVEEAVVSAERGAAAHGNLM